MLILNKLTIVSAGGPAIAMAVVLAAVVHGGSLGGASLKAAGSRAIDTPCSAQQPGTIGLLGQVAPGHSARELQAQGYRVYTAIAGTLGQRAGDRDNLVEIGSRLEGGQPAELSVLRLNPTLSAAGAVMAQSLDPALRSCNYRLDNKPAATRLVANAETAIVRARLTTRAEFGKDSTIFMVSDNPLDSAQVLVTVDVAGPTIPDPFEATSNLHSLVPIIAVVNRASGQVLQVGFGAWYAAN